MKSVWPAALVALLLAPALGAQGVTIHAEVDRTQVSLDEEVVLSVSVSGDQANVPDPLLPSLPNFNVYPSGQTQSINIVNGKVSSSRVYNYVLKPRFPGKTTIDPIRVVSGGKTFATDPIQIVAVRPGSAAQPPPNGGSTERRQAQQSRRGGGDGSDVYVTASLDKEKVYVNEQLTLTVRFHTAVNLLGNAQYDPPTIQGFILEELPPERHGEISQKGRVFHFSEIKTALFPAQSGKLVIGSAKVRCQVQPDSVDPFASDFFQKFLYGGLAGQTRELKTTPLPVQVLPLPDKNKPEYFSGAVGRFRVTAGVDRKSVKVGEAITFSLTVEGNGNLKALDAPKLPEMPSFRAFDTVTSMSMTKAKDVVTGSKVFKTVLVPRASGKLSIPSIPFSFFDPAVGDYVRAGTAPIELEVTGGGPTSPVVGFVTPETSTPGVTSLQEDIRYVKDKPGRSPLSSALAVAAGSLWIHILPLLAFLGATLYGRYDEYLKLDPVGARFRGALAKARKQLRKAQTLASTEPAKAVEILSATLSGFLADKLNLSAQGLTLREVQQKLKTRFPRSSDDTMIQLKAVWEDLEQMRFAGAQQLDVPRTDALVSEIDAVLETIEKEARR
ncbi:MAG: BatD family protein [Elusimicrobia bacterium]|nr:BatD family protein [Elusimicrobiota bacterium]